MKFQKRSQGKRGYRLHDERIAYSGGTGSMRSIKYELADPSGITGLRDKIAEAVASDNKWLYGNINLNDYLTWRAEKTNEQIANGEREYSFLRFWLKALSLGFIFSKQSHAPNDFSEQLLPNLFDTIDDNLRDKLKKDKWCEFVKSGTAKTTDDKLKNQIANLLSDEKHKDDEKVKEIIKKYRENKKDKFGLFGLQKPNNDNYPRIRAVDEDTGKESQKNAAFYCDPDFEIIDGKDTTKLLDEIIRRYNDKYKIDENKKDDKTSNRIALYSLNQGYIPRVLNDLFLFVKKGDFRDYLKACKSYFGDSYDTDTVKNRLDELMKIADVLPERPQIVKVWGDYANDFGGKLESWYSNRLEKLKKAPEQMIELDRMLDKINEVLKLQTNTDSEKQLITETKEYIKDYVAKTEQPKIFVNTWTVEKKKTKTEEARTVQYWVEKIADREFTEKLESLLAELRSKLNEHNQQNKVVATKKKKGVKVGDEVGSLDDKLGGTKSEDGESNEAGWQKILSKHIQSAPLFYGESKRLLFEQTYNLKSLIKTEIQKVGDILDKAIDLDKYQDEANGLKKNEKGSRTINTLARFYERFGQDGYDGNTQVKDILESIATEIGVNFIKKDTERFYLSGRERDDRLKCIEWSKTLTAERLVELSRIRELFGEYQKDFNNLNLFRDTIQLARTVVAVVMTDADKKDQIENNYIFSQLSGYNAILSKKQVVVRYQLQSTGSDGNKNNVFAGGNQVTLGAGLQKPDKQYMKHKKGEKPEELRNKEVQRYFYVFKNYELDDDKKVALTKICKAKDNTDSPESDIVKTTAKYPALKVASSRYQIQFLGWFFGKHSQKKTKLKLSGAFVIAEKIVDIDWSGDNPKTSEKDHRIFVSQPFELLPPENPEFDAKNIKNIKNRFIGVDIGEYGLAWSLIKVEDNQVKQLDSDFIADNQQQVLKNEVKSWRASQVRQTFTAMDTKVARLRESLIGSYRNQLESLALSKNATLSFEYEVSGFEIGGKKVAKIYDSIKQADVLKGGGDNDEKIKSSWGGYKAGAKTRPLPGEKLNYAKETTAAGTSQFCTKCKTWASLDLDENGDYQLEDYKDGLLKTKLKSGRYVRLFAPHNKSGDTVKGKDLKGMIYKAMRPNEDGLGIEIVKREKNWQELSKTFGAGKDRGNIGIYVCPYVDCRHISDADLQAAFNIAVRGYFKANPPTGGQDKNGKIKEGYLSKEKLCELEASLDFEAICGLS
ncbi:MAG: type V CRISPR-associated protein Cas12d [Candidatus Nomurabacteria bacterium]|jgi:hypothetical protein|nr:type V CRISPR-associated protein Cas12d [Candidatus Nomurabacteria bacterium]